jgi:hypothetical protein
VDIPINAEVQCADGACGRSTYVVLDLETDEATDLLVREEHVPGAERVVAIDQVVEANPHLIRLRRSRQQLARCKGIRDASFSVTRNPTSLFLLSFFAQVGAQLFISAMRYASWPGIKFRADQCRVSNARCGAFPGGGWAG